MSINSLFLFQDGFFQGPGDPEAYSSYTMQILGMLFVSFLLGYLLRFFIGAKWKTMALSLETEVKTYKAANNQLELDVNKARYEQEKVQEELKKTKGQYGDSLVKIKALEEQLQDLQSGNEAD